MSPHAGRPFVVGNWKMNGLGEGLGEVEAVAAACRGPDLAGVDLALCPPATLLDRARALTQAERRLALGGQDCAVAASGAHTGDVSAEMLRDAGASLVVLGHCERRGAHREDDALVRAKAEAARRGGLLAVICVGETLEERDAGRAERVVAAQVAGSLPPGAGPAGIAVAYEPVWAIGTGRTPSGADVAAMHAVIRRELLSALGPGAERVSILYGGSVKPDNAAALIALDGVGGFLVGGASLRAADFLAIARAASGGGSAP